MSRPLRIEYPDAWYHVMRRARLGQEVRFPKINFGLKIEIRLTFFWFFVNTPAGSKSNFLITHKYKLGKGFK